MVTCCGQHACEKHNRAPAPAASAQPWVPAHLRAHAPAMRPPAPATAGAPPATRGRPASTA
eukprot:10348449-Lingulodinium_polyedra.AAC.1